MLPSSVSPPGNAVNDLTFGHFVIQCAARQVQVDGKPARLGARAFDLLMTLVERRNTVVSKNELLDVVWPGLVVEENNLQVHVSTLRKLLGPQTIVTIPGRGYRFAAPPDETLDGPDTSGKCDAHATRLKTSIAAARIGNLPSQLSALLGRETELAALARLLPSHRLITITGAGGMGKTRLALAAAFAVSHERSVYPEGVWLVEFAPVNDRQLVLLTLARTLGVALDADASADELAERLADSKMLIVLDNCEHLAADVATVAAALLRAAPQVRLLATSQESLKLAGEQVMRLGALSLPQDEPVNAHNNAHYGAVTLFAKRACEAMPQFVLGADNQSAVVEICRRLDGIPLAIEFAAARLPLLGIEGLRRRLDDRFRLLVGGSRLAPQRQQTLYAALEWSHALLAPDEQIVFHRLAVFKASFGLNAAQVVGAGSDYDEWVVLDHLAALVDKCLIISEPGVAPRYRLLESARAFALARLQEANELPAAMRRLAEAVLAQFQTAHAACWTVNTEQLLATTLPDLDNLRAALVWAASDAGDPAHLVALVGAANWFWKPANVAAEGVRWNRTATACIPANSPPAIEARLLLSYASLSHQSEADKELAALHRAVLLYRAIDDRRGLYESLTVLAQKHIWQHDLSAAGAAIAEAAALYEAAWPRVMREGLLTARTYWLEVSGRAAEGEPLMAELVALMRSLGDERKLDHALMQMAESLFVQGKAADAIIMRREVEQRIGQRRVNYAASNLGNLCAALTFNDELDEALQTARAAFPLIQHEGALGTCADHFALLACKMGRPADGARLLGRSDANFRASGFLREESELRAVRMTLDALRTAMSASELAARFAEGAAMTDEAAIRAALGIDRRSAERAA